MALRDAIQTDRTSKLGHTAPHRRMRELSHLLDAAQWADLIDCIEDETIKASELSRAFRANLGLSLGEKVIRAWREDPGASVHAGRADDVA